MNSILIVKEKLKDKLINKNILRSFFMMMKFIKKDSMLIAASFAPVLAGIAIKCGIPYLEKILTSYLKKEFILSPYYSLFDIFFASLTPCMFCFIAAMVILEEHDDHIQSYLFITALGKTGYFFFFFVIPLAISFVITAVLLPIFSLTKIKTGMIFLTSFFTALEGIIVALLVTAFSSNKLEGMAVTKLSTITIFGSVAPYFIPGKYAYIISFLPSFWIGKSFMENNPLFMTAGIFESFIYIFFLFRKLLKKIS